MQPWQQLAQMHAWMTATDAMAAMAPHDGHGS